MKPKFKSGLIPFFLPLLLLLFSCMQEWDSYYAVPDKTEQKMWDEITENPRFSEFVRYMRETKMDTIFKKSQPYTLFIPDNESFENFTGTGIPMARVLGYHIIKSVLIPSNIRESRRVQTYFGKFALIERMNDGYFLDGIKIANASPLFKDGMFYEVSEVLSPRPTIYEYMDYTIPVVRDYIDSRDSVGFNPLLSEPVGFDAQGNTVYDSVFTRINRFERDFFPVRQEVRDNLATFLLFSEEQYNQALDQMADNLGEMFTGHEDIPEVWQMQVLIPYLLRNGVFSGALQYEDFLGPLRNIRWDPTPVDHENIDPDSRFISSNGVVFNYLNLTVPERLYMEPLLYEGERLVKKPAGSDEYEWIEGVRVSDFSRKPNVLSSSDASGGEYLTVPLPRNFSQSYSIEFTFNNVFPGNYQLKWRAYFRPSGVIRFYVDDRMIGFFDNNLFRLTVDGNPTSGSFNSKIFQVGEISEFGDIVIRVEYTGPGIATNNGLCIDYIALLPVR